MIRDGRPREGRPARQLAGSRRAELRLNAHGAAVDVDLRATLASLLRAAADRIEAAPWRSAFRILTPSGQVSFTADPPGPWSPVSEHRGREARRSSLAEVTENLAARVRRLGPSHGDPHRFHEEKDEIEHELRLLASKLDSA
jgi:hypothetical protein